MTEGTVAAGLETRAAATAESLVRLLGGSSRSLALAESCTAGLVADLLARVSGASRVLWGSFVCYTAAAKIAMLGLDGERLARHGLVSGETAGDMALGALEKSGAALAAAVTGLAGPDGDGSGTALGTVWVALAAAEGLSGARLRGTWEFHFHGSRNEIRLQAAAAVLEELMRICS